MAKEVTGTVENTEKKAKAPKKSFKKTHYFPELGKSVDAETLEEAQEIAKK